MLLEFASSKSSSQLAFGGLEGTVVRRLALASPWALLSTLLWGDAHQIKKRKAVVGPKWKWLGVIHLNCQNVFLNMEKCPEAVCSVQHKGLTMNIRVYV